MYYVSKARNGQDCSSHFPVAVTMSEFIETGMQQSYGCHHLAEAARTASEAAVYGDSSQTYRRLYPTTF